MMTAMDVDIEATKAANPIELVVAETEPLTGTGRYRKGSKHDSLVVDTKNQAYFWNSMGDDDSGDVITWVIKHRGCADFKDAVEWLCRRANLPAPEWSSGDAKARLAARARDDALTVAARWFVRQLRASLPAREYAASRGWSDETIRLAGLGYSGDGASRQDLVGELAMHGHDAKADVVKAILKIPPGMLVYAHVRSGRVRYLSARSIADKRHYNLEAELAGERQLYLNHLWAPTEERVVIVEGQADAVTLGQWGIPAIALAGVSAGEQLGLAVRGHKRLYIGLDSDRAGLPAAMKLARELGPLTRLVTWPAKDANDWLQALEADPSPVEVEARLDDARPFVELLCADAGKAPAATRLDARKDAFRVIARMESGDAIQMRKALCKLLDLDQREFNNLLKIARQEINCADDGDEPAPREETYGGYIGEHLLDLIYDAAANETRLAVRMPGGELATLNQITIEGTRYDPPWVTDMQAKGVVLFPSAIGPEVPPLELRRRIQAFIRKYLDIPRVYERLASYYVMFTWLYDCFRTVPYLRVLGDSGTGKSRFLDTIGLLCYRPIKTMGATTPAPIFRLLDKYKGTLILDEADFKKGSDTSADIIKIINVGFSRGTPVLRSGSDRSDFEPEAYVVFGPKILATRKKFEDDATEKRCLTHQAGSPTTRSDIPLHLNDAFDAEALALRNLLLTYRLKHWRPEIQVDESRIDRQAVEPRLNQIILGLISMVEDEDLRDDINRLVREYNADLIMERSMGLPAKVLQALVEIRSGPHAGLQTTGEPYWDLSVKRIAVVVNRLIDADNESDAEEDEPPAAEKKYQANRAVKNKAIAKICRDVFQLTVARTNYGTRSAGVEWETERVKGLCARYGVDWKEPAQPGSSPADAEAVGPVGSLL